MGILALAGAALFLEPVRETLGGPPGRDAPGGLCPGWLAAPMRADTFLATSDFVPARGTVELPAGYWPPPDKFNPPPLPGGDRNAPGFTLARVAALGGGEERLVLCSSYEHGLLPRVYLRGEVVSAADLALPAGTLGQLGRGAPNLNPTLVLRQNVSRRQPPASVDLLSVLIAVPIVGALLVLPFTVIGLMIWRRQAVRRRQVRELRRRLGLPEPATARAGVVSPA